jgi:CheY-like chemotaxis protein
MSLVTPAASDSWFVKADANQIEQVILNLAVNARDAMPQGGRLTIETASLPGRQLEGRLAGIDPNRDYVVLRVTDTGLGMDAETLTRLFEPFFTTKEAGEGTGLGLAVVHGIVRQHEGAVHVESEPGRGTAFAIYLPQAVESGATAESAPAIFPPLTGHGTILLAEDDEQVRVLTGEILAMNGYTVLQAAHGAEALRIVGQHGAPIDLLIADVVMFGVSGPQLARSVVSMRPDIKVLYLSGHTADALRRHGVLRPDFMMLRKPFTPMALLEAVRQTFGGGPGFGKPQRSGRPRASRAEGGLTRSGSDHGGSAGGGPAGGESAPRLVVRRAVVYSCHEAMARGHHARPRVARCRPTVAAVVPSATSDLLMANRAIDARTVMSMCDVFKVPGCLWLTMMRFCVNSWPAWYGAIDSARSTRFPMGERRSTESAPMSTI